MAFPWCASLLGPFAECQRAQFPAYAGKVQRSGGTAGRLHQTQKAQHYTSMETTLPVLGALRPGPPRGYAQAFLLGRVYFRNRPSATGVPPNNSTGKQAPHPAVTGFRQGFFFVFKRQVLFYNKANGQTTEYNAKFYTFKMKCDK